MNPTAVPNDDPDRVVMTGLYDGSPNCPNCGAPPSEQEVRNYSMMWHDGDVHCTRCGTRVRSYDAG